MSLAKPDKMQVVVYNDEDANKNLSQNWIEKLRSPFCTDIQSLELDPMLQQVVREVDIIKKRKDSDVDFFYRAMYVRVVWNIATLTKLAPGQDCSRYSGGIDAFWLKYGGGIHLSHVQADALVSLKMYWPSIAALYQEPG